MTATPVLFIERGSFSFCSVRFKNSLLRQSGSLPDVLYSDSLAVSFAMLQFALLSLKEVFTIDKIPLYAIIQL